MVLCSWATQENLLTWLQIVEHKLKLVSLQTKCRMVYVQVSGQNLDLNNNQCMYIWAWMGQNLSSGFPNSNQSPQLQRLARKMECRVASLVMILSKKQITKVLISLCRCTGWSVPSLFANPEDRFSCIKAYLKPIHICNKQYHYLMGWPIYFWSRSFRITSRFL